MSHEAHADEGPEGSASVPVLTVDVASSAPCALHARSAAGALRFRRPGQKHCHKPLSHMLLIVASSLERCAPPDAALRLTRVPLLLTRLVVEAGAASLTFASGRQKRRPKLGEAGLCDSELL